LKENAAWLTPRVKHTSTVKKIYNAFRNGQIVKKAATGDALAKTFMMELLKKGLNNMMAGGGFTVLIHQVAKESQTNKGLEVVN
jgi:hypothetical protein